MSKPQQSITSLPQSPDEERHGRMVRYSVAMGVRMVCVVLAIVLHGWFQLIAVIGAIILPYFAVIIANVSMRHAGAAVERPGAITRWNDQ
jgi:ABC-type protease/lipase transport system fused ATPase/permease subunit